MKIKFLIIFMFAFISCSKERTLSGYVYVSELDMMSNTFDFKVVFGLDCSAIARVVKSKKELELFVAKNKIELGEVEYGKPDIQDFSNVVPWWKTNGITKYREESIMDRENLDRNIVVDFSNESSDVYVVYVSAYK